MWCDPALTDHHAGHSFHPGPPLTAPNSRVFPPTPEAHTQPAGFLLGEPGQGILTLSPALALPPPCDGSQI